MRKKKENTIVIDKSEIRKRVILNAGRSVLIDKGLIGFSMRKVAAQSGIRLASLQHHFPTREDLLISLMEDGLRQQLPYVLKIKNQRNVDVRMKLEQTSECLLRYISERQNAAFAFQIWSLSANEPRMYKMQKKINKDLFDTIATIILDANPAIKTKESQIRAVEFKALIDGFALYQLILAHSAEGLDRVKNEIRRRAIDLALRS